MPVQDKPEGTGSRAKAGWAAGVVLGVAVGALGVLVIARQVAFNWPGHWLARSTQIDVSQPTVVDRIQQLQRLETVVYTMDKIVSGEKDNPILPDFLTGDRLLMLVHGQVVAGIDFSRLRGGDISIEGKDVRVRLPQPQIFMTR